MTEKTAKQTLDEKKASMGDPSETADPVTGKGGSNHHRGADKPGGEKAPIMQGKSPNTRAGMISDAMNAMKGMDTDELKGLVKTIRGSGKNGPGEQGTIMQGNSRLKEALAAVLGTISEEDLEDIDDDSIDLINAFLESEDAPEPVRITTEDVDTSTITEFLTNNDLSEEAADRVATIFEAEVVNRVNEMVTDIAERTVEDVEDSYETVVGHVDGYLNYVVEQWMEDNAVEVENAIRAEIAEGFMQRIAEAFAEHYIEVPDDKVDVVDALGAEVNELEENLNAALEEVVELSDTCEQLKRDAILADMAEGMSVADAQQLIELTDNVAYGDEESFEKKVGIIRESYFTDGVADDTLETGGQVLVEEYDDTGGDAVDDDDETYRHDDVRAAMAALRRTARK